MNLLLNGMVRATAETFELPEPIVEIGSYQVEGQEQMIDLRAIFRERLGIGLSQQRRPDQSEHFQQYCSKLNAYA